MESRFRVALAQINTTVGDLEGNTSKILEYLARAKEIGADLVAFPELAITGYPPEDLLLKAHFISDSLAELSRIAESCHGITAIVGTPDADTDIYNSAAVLRDGKIAGMYHKIYLPNYGVFDEDRYFKAGNTCTVYQIDNIGIGVNICEDMWYALGPTTLQKENGAKVIVNINGSPFQAGKLSLRKNMIATRAADNEVFLCYVNMVGGQDELVFDGGSMIYDPKGQLIALGPQFEENLVVADLDVSTMLHHRLHDPRPRKQLVVGALGAELNTHKVTIDGSSPSRRPPIAAPELATLDEIEAVSKALVLGTRDYVRKNGFNRVVVGLSGGIDSTLVAAIATDALGSESVVGISMPSRYNAPESEEDARILANNLGIAYHVITIEDTFKASLDMLGDIFENTEPNVAEENLQARIRGNLLMAISNKFGWLVLTTGNKSEMAMGYATLYGDMAGGFAVIKDVPKTLVYALARHWNLKGDKEIIPVRVIEKAPTAELRYNQKDEDSLPPYHVLDPILKAYVEEDRSFEEILGLGFDEGHAKQVIMAVDRNEYKRRQAPPGIKITPKAFGRDRRLPIVNRYRAF